MHSGSDSQDMDSGGVVLSVEGVEKRFAEGGGRVAEALKSVSFDVREGGITALVGPDGAGKTTMLRIIAGLLGQDGGRLRLFGREVSGGAEDLREQIGYMPQKFGLYEDLTVQENLDLYADLRGLLSSEREARYAELLGMTGLEHFRERLAGNLSGGMKQKLGLICTLVQPPRLLLLDEPTVGVDPLSRRELWAIIERLASGAGMSVVVSTSYMDEASKCDDVVLLLDGTVLAEGKPDDIRTCAAGMSYLAEPVEGDTPRALQSRLFRVDGVIDAVPQGGQVRLVHGELTAGQSQDMEKALRGAKTKPVEASLEDSFMLLLRRQMRDGAKEKRHSPDAGKVIPSPAAREDEDPVIETKGVYRYFGDFIAVNNVSFTVNRGEVFGLLGPNGAGKTTTFRMLCGLLPATRGVLKVAGVDVRKAREKARARIGYVAQKFSLYGLLTVRENLKFFANSYGLRGKKCKERMENAVNDFSLGEHLDMPSGMLPGGYKQRLAMAAALMHEPSILFLDEPTSGADPLARREFWQRITALSEKGVTVVVTTHFMEEAEYCDRVLIQSDGVMLALDTPGGIRTGSAGVGGTMEDAFIAIVERGRQEKGGGA